MGHAGRAMVCERFDLRRQSAVLGSVLRALVSDRLKAAR